LCARKPYAADWLDASIMQDTQLNAKPEGELTKTPDRRPTSESRFNESEYERWSESCETPITQKVNERNRKLQFGIHSENRCPNCTGTFNLIVVRGSRDQLI
jgi:hypothetical protein